MSETQAPPRQTATFDPSSQLAVIQGGSAALAEARALVVDSDVMYEEAGTVLAQVKGSIKRIEDAKESMLKPVREIERAIRSFFDPAIKARQEVEATLKNKMIGYRTEQERKAAEAQRAAEEAARKERERLEREAAAARAKAEQEAAEARRQAEEAERKRAEAEAAGNARAAAAAAAQAAKLNEQAQQKAEAGERTAAELTERASLTSAQVLDLPAAPKAAGTSIRRPWKGRVKDKNALIKSIAKNPEAYGHLLDVNESALNALAKAQHKGIEAVLEGVEAYQDAQMGARAG